MPTPWLTISRSRAAIGALIILGLLAVALALRARAAPTIITVQAREFAFGPNVIHARAGRPIQLRLANEGILTHDILVEGDPAAHVVAPAQQTVTGQPVTFAKPGTYRFECTIPGHAEHGMVGRLVVDP